MEFLSVTRLAPVGQGKVRGLSSRWLLCLLGLAMASCTAIRPERLSTVPKWSRFEQTFQSSSLYSNAIQQATLTVLFVSPLGETNRVYGFWDGGQTWRVRFSPDQAGRWSYETICSSPADKGLHHQTGAFLCTAPSGTGRFKQHGPVRVARDRRHFEHADGTPFFWLADCASHGARLSDLPSWQRYSEIRAGQEFTAVRWFVAPGVDWCRQSACSGTNQIAVNPEFFQRLDAKVEAMNQAGILSVIQPFWDIDTLPGKPADAEVILLLRHMLARWGASDVAWLLAVDNTDARETERYKQIGRAVFGERPHAPVILQSRVNGFAQFRDESWADALGYRSDMSEKSFTEFFSGPFVEAWQKNPSRPLLNMLILEDLPTRLQRQFGDADEARRAAWLGLLLAPPAGVGYGTIDVVTWNSTTNRPENHPPGEVRPPWEEALSFPGAKQMTILANIMNSIEYWRLVPSPQIVALQPEVMSPRRYIAAAATDTKDLTVVYVPEERTVELSLQALPPAPVVKWINPRTGETSAAVAVVADRRCQFPTPDPGDWLLVIKAGK